MGALIQLLWADSSRAKASMWILCKHTHWLVKAVILTAIILLFTSRWWQEFVFIDGVDCVVEFHYTDRKVPRISNLNSISPSPSLSFCPPPLSNTGTHTIKVSEWSRSIKELQYTLSSHATAPLHTNNNTLIPFYSTCSCRNKICCASPPRTTVWEWPSPSLLLQECGC